MTASQPLYDIRFPAADCRDLTQDEAFFYLYENGNQQKLRFHDYDLIYQCPGLYEQLFYKRLRYSSPAKAAELPSLLLVNHNEQINGLRDLDLV